MSADWIESGMEVIPATVPILRLTDKVSALQVDVNVESTVGVRNTHLLHSYAQCKCQRAPLGSLHTLLFCSTPTFLI